MCSFPETLRFDTQLHSSHKKMALFLPGIKDNTNLPPAPFPSLEMARMNECGPESTFLTEFHNH